VFVAKSLYCGTKRVRDSGRIRLEAHQSAGAAPRRGIPGVVGQLHVRKIELRAQRFRVVRIETPLFYVADNADDFRAASFALQNDALPDRVLAGKILPRENVIHYNDVGSVLIVPGREKPPSFQRNPHHLQIIFLDDITQGPAHVVLALRLWPPLDPEKIFVVAAQWYRAPGQRRGSDSWNGGKRFV
jgi:hypothetical protein